VKEIFIRRVLKRRYQRHREPQMSRIYGRFFSRRISELGVDVAISLKAIPLPKITAKVPLVLYNDAPFGALHNFYAEFTGLSAASVANGEAMERAANRNAAHSIYSSTWGAQKAHELYGTPLENISVIEMGANLEVSHDAAQVKALIDERLADPLWRFLWLGVDWQRKGGDVAVEIIQELRARGYNVELAIAGVPNAPLPPDLPYIRNLGFLKGREIAAQLARSHFLLLPTRADCTPLVYNEANAFGVPVISTNVGGIPTSIRDGKNGRICDLDAPLETWLAMITPYLHDPAAYRELGSSSFEEYRTRLNWHTAATRIMEVLERLVEGRTVIRR
jgi:glycosyltransferase involved in cell wall biosynthesis